MKKTVLQILILPALLFFTSCVGIRYMSIETREPAQVTLPKNIRSILVVNNVVKQPHNVGHNKKALGKRGIERVNESADSIAIFYTEALTQFLTDNEYFDKVKLYSKPMRTDNDFWNEKPLLPETTNELRKEYKVDAIVALDKLILQTDWEDHFMQEGYKYASMKGQINSTIRVYLPSWEGKIPTVRYSDSLTWQGYDIRDGAAYADEMIPTPKAAMKELAIAAADKMTQVFSPHWDVQDRWYYTSMSSSMREGETFALANQWSTAIEKWKTAYESTRKSVGKARAATNIALAYEMLGDMDRADEWAETANELFEKGTTTNSLDRKRSVLYKSEIKRRKKAEDKLKEQFP